MPSRQAFSLAEHLWLWPSSLLLENGLSNLTLDRIEKELQLLNTNLAEANDIAMLSAFSSMPADLDNESRAAMRLLRDKMMVRALARAGL